MRRCTTDRCGGYRCARTGCPSVGSTAGRRAMVGHAALMMLKFMAFPSGKAVCLVNGACDMPPAASVQIRQLRARFAQHHAACVAIGVVLRSACSGYDVAFTASQRGENNVLVTQPAQPAAQQSVAADRLRRTRSRRFYNRSVRCAGWSAGRWPPVAREQGGRQRPRQVTLRRKRDQGTSRTTRRHRFHSRWARYMAR